MLFCTEICLDFKYIMELFFKTVFEVNKIELNTSINKKPAPLLCNTELLLKST